MRDTDLMLNTKSHGEMFQMSVTKFPMVHILSEISDFSLHNKGCNYRHCSISLCLISVPWCRPVNELLSHLTRVPYSQQLYSDYVSYRHNSPSSIAPPVYGPSTLVPPVYGPSSIVPQHYGPSTISPGKKMSK